MPPWCQHLYRICVFNTINSRTLDLCNTSILKIHTISLSLICKATTNKKRVIVLFFFQQKTPALTFLLFFPSPPTKIIHCDIYALQLRQQNFKRSPHFLIYELHKHRTISAMQTLNLRSATPCKQRWNGFHGVGNKSTLPLLSTLI